MRTTTRRHLAACAIAALCVASRASAQGRTACRPTTVVDEAVAPSVWSAGLRALGSVLARSDRPWSCAGAVVRLAFDASGLASVEAVMPDGTSLRRRVGRPSELVATVEGMLYTDASVDAPEAPSAPPAAPAALVDRERPPPISRALPVAPAAPASAVRLDVFADVLLRVGSTPTYLTPGLRVGAGALFGRWSADLSVRFETFSTALSNDLRGLTIDTWVIGVGGAWNVRVGAGIVSVGPTLAVAGCTVQLGRERDRVEDTLAQARAGVSVRWRSRARGLAATAGVDGDAAFATLFGSEHDYLPSLPAPPAWSAAAFVGIAYGGEP